MPTAGSFRAFRLIEDAVLAPLEHFRVTDASPVFHRRRLRRLVRSQALIDYLRPLHLSPTEPHALAIVAGQIARQAEMGAILDVFKVTMWSFLAMLLLVMLLRRKR